MFESRDATPPCAPRSPTSKKPSVTVFESVVTCPVTHDLSAITVVSTATVSVFAESSYVLEIPVPAVRAVFTASCASSLKYEASTAIVIVLAPSLYVFVSPLPTVRAVLIASWEISPIATSELFAYERAVHVEDPLPNLNKLVSDSTPNSPAAKIGFTEVHCAAVPLLT